MNSEELPRVPDPEPDAFSIQVPTRDYERLQAAFDHFNRELFEGQLPQALLTLGRAAGVRGYFSGDRFASRNGEASAHEIALNPARFKGVSDEDILSTLAHEMVHLWQRVSGRYSWKGHNREWAEKMNSIGLLPTATGEPGGTQTGRDVTHCVVEGGPFQQSAQTFLASAGVTWQDARSLGEPHRKISAAAANRKRRRGFECPRCGQRAEAQAAAALNCGFCAVPMAGLHEVEGAEAPAVRLIAAAIDRSDYDTAELLFDHCLEICAGKPARMHPIAEGVATGLRDCAGPGRGLRSKAAGWLVDFMKGKSRQDQMRLLKDLLDGEDAGEVLEVVLPALSPDRSDEHGSALLQWMAGHEDERIRSAAVRTLSLNP